MQDKNLSFFLILTLLFSSSALTPLHAKNINNPLATLNFTPKKNVSFQLQADRLIYQHQTQKIIAEGHIHAQYDGNTLNADRLIYDQMKKNVIAQGHVIITRPDNTKIFSDSIDMTEDLGTGFIHALEVETAQQAFFHAQKAERTADKKFIFQNASYTACQKCLSQPQKQPLWQIKAKKIVWDQAQKKISFQNSSFNVAGYPLLYLPYLSLPDPTIQRATGLLMPHIFYKSQLGYAVSQDFFLNLSPYYDVTLNGTFYTNQGLLGKLLWRQRLITGQYDLLFAGLRQRHPHNFDPSSVDYTQNWRGLIASRGSFQFNTIWQYGWDILLSSDKDFARTYNISPFNDYMHLSTLYLHGINGQNHLNIDFYRFDVQSNLPDKNPFWDQLRQPLVLPTIDYHYTLAKSIASGRLNFNFDTRSIYWQHAHDSSKTNKNDLVQNNNHRLGGSFEWQRQFILSKGLVLTPLLGARTDLFYQDQTAPSTKTTLRLVATAGFDARYPILFKWSKQQTAILEPIAQLWIRNNEPYAGLLPNEDAQSLVFSADNLFSRDKFSGHDRIEGGTRANIGFRYSASTTQWNTSLIAGQSFQLAGKNSYASPNPYQIDENSGLEHKRSDYVVGLNTQNHKGLLLSINSRFNKDNFHIERNTLTIQKDWQNFSINSAYIYVRAQPQYHQNQDIHAISFSVNRAIINKSWQLYGNISYDIPSQTIIGDGFGLSYLNDCLNINIGYTQTRNPGNPIPTNQFNFGITLRTLGTIKTNSQ